MTDGVTDELAKKILQAIADPGHFLKRGGDYTEPIPEWSARAVVKVLNEWLADPDVAEWYGVALIAASREARRLAAAGSQVDTQ